MSTVQGAANYRLDADHAARRDAKEARRLRNIAVSTYARMVRDRGDGTPGTQSSVHNCEKVPTSDGNPQTAERSSDARTALLSARSRSRDRETLVNELIQAGEVAHAKRFANCMRQSVQLECPEIAGGCGSDDNYTPMTCDSRLCPDCAKRRQGNVASTYGPVVASMDWPTLMTVTGPGRIDCNAEAIQGAISSLREAFSRLRRRVIPPNGPGYSWADWKASLTKIGARQLARAWEIQYVDEGRGIPFSEVMQSGFYAVDVKQQPDGRLHIHMHVIGDCPWVPQAAVSNLWDELLEAPVVDVRRVDGRGAGDAKAAALEVAGYAAKAPDFNSAKAEVEYLKAVKGSKLVQPFGALHGNTPDIHGRLCCSDCGAAPGYWNYVGMVDGTYDNMGADWTAEGDRPPPDVVE